MQRKKGILRFAATLLSGAVFLTGCAGTQPGFIYVNAIDEPVMIITERLDGYLMQDESLTESDRAMDLRFNQGLRDIIEEARQPASP